MRVKWLRTALKDLDAGMTYLAEQSPSAARDMYALIRKRTEMLAQFPDMGRPGRVYGTRELVLDRFPCVMPYRVKDGDVEILRVFHMRRRVPDDRLQ